MRRAAIALTVILALCLLHTRAGAEFCIVTIDALFAAALIRGQRLNFRQPWLIIALIWWGWEVICSTPIRPLGLGAAGWYDLAEALALIRFIILIAALQLWVLTTPAARRAAWLALALSCLWIGLESWQQYLTGHNLFGDRRWPDGSLTGPFWEPRAGAPYAHLLCVALLPIALPLLNRRRLIPRLAAGALAIIGLATSVLIGQRMPTLLAFLALATSALFLPRLRPAALVALVIGAAVIAATPIISPPTYHKLVVHFIAQMRHFATSPYGELYTRATVMGLASPWHGYGFDGFRNLCPLPQFGAGLPRLHIAPTQIGLGACNIHPHNFYLQALIEAGLPGLLLFTAMNLAWLITLARGLWRAPAPLRVGLFAGVLTYAWPFASSDSFAILPHIGWLLMLLGLGLATAQIQPNPSLDAQHA